MTRAICFGLCLTAATLDAQRAGHRPSTSVYGRGTILNPGGGRPGHQFGQGNILFPSGATSFPGGISNPRPHSSYAGNAALRGRGHGGRDHGGRDYGGRDYRGRDHGGRDHGRDHGGRGRTYAVPVYVGGGWGWGWDGGWGYQEPQATNVTVVMPQQPAPQVIINHNYVPETARPVMRDYSNEDLPEPSSSGVRVYDVPAPGGGTGDGVGVETEATEFKPRAATAKTRPDDKPTIYLIALKDSTVRAAIGYWIEDGSLHYVTPQGHINHVSAELLDRPTTDQLNRERGLEFDLRH